jgi:F-type H+-transporting ATPase subunit a
MRALLVLAIVAAACFTAWRFTPHHEGRNAFETLYMHLVPAPLVQNAHGAPEEQRYLLAIPLPAALAFMDVGVLHGGAEHGETPVAGDGEEHAAPHTALFNLQIFQLAAVLLCLVCFLDVPSYVRTGKGDALSRVFAGFAMWIRDEMVYPVMGRDRGRRFLPYFLTVFFFILFMNLLGLVPFAATATASIFVTGALAITTLLAMIVCGMVAQGPIAFWKNLVPHVPLPLWPLMFFVELIGLVVKPFALMVRLFANMTGGHLVVLSFVALIFFAATQWGAVGGWGASPIGVGFAVFIMIIESFVALLQAYIFTQLSIIFVSASVHPEH